MVDGVDTDIYKVHYGKCVDFAIIENLCKIRCDAKLYTLVKKVSAIIPPARNHSGLAMTIDLDSADFEASHGLGGNVSLDVPNRYRL